MTTEIMGIVNLTPDSFSDGGILDNPERAAEYVQRLIDTDATIIDIGGESTRPGDGVVSLEEELSRTIPVIQQLTAVLPKGVSVSIDTRKPAVAASALDAGASMINDISGFCDPDMIELAVRSGAHCIVMHMQGEPENMQDEPFYVDVLQEVTDYLLQRANQLVEAGVDAEKIYLDPGFGFGKTKTHNLELLVNLNTMARAFRKEGYKLAAGISRKSLIGQVLGIEDPLARDLASAQLATAMAADGVSLLRVHDVASTVAEIERCHKGESAHSEAYLALGSNLGGPIANIATALVYIDKLPLTRLKEVASPVLSEPAYDLDQMDFTNTVCRIETGLGPLALFTYLQAIEADMGREKFRENGPRVIDIDLLTFASDSIDLPGLSLPHPRITERAFVLEPLAEIAPDFTLPDGQPPKAADTIYGSVKAVMPLELLTNEIAKKKQRDERATQFQEGYTKDPYDNWDDWNNWK